MLPEFPQFKQLSILNNNLAVRFTDYLTGNPFFSFLGDKKVLAATVFAFVSFFVFLGNVSFINAQSPGALLERPNSVFVSGNYAYVTSELSNALEVIDISNPAAPLHKGSITHGEAGAVLYQPSSVAVSGNYAYVTVPLANAVEIIDVSDGANPFHKDTLFHGDGGANLRRPLFITVSGNYAYVLTRAQNIEILDISDPISPTHAGSYYINTLTVLNSAFVSGDYLYVTFSCLCSGGGGVRIVDISDPTHPVSKGGIDDGTDGISLLSPGSPYVSGDHLYITSPGVLEIVNISDPDNITREGVLRDGDGGAALFDPIKVSISGNYAYVISYSGNALEIADISDSAHPTHKGEFHYEGEASYPKGIAVSGNYAYIPLSLENAFDILDISDPARPVRKSKLLNGELVGTPTGCVMGCFSNVLFLPGIKGSILKKGADTLWPPTVFDFSNDVLQLALTDEGESVNDVFTDGILNEFIITPIYAPFSDFMDDLIENEKLINEWLPLAYDWRFSPEKVIEDGIKTENETINIIENIEELAVNSKTGRVSIVSHSTGGLLGKAIIKKLQEEGKDNLIDSFVMIGAPQLGTPQAVAAVLHGDNEGIVAGLIAHPADMRKVAQNMPSAYNLLPSPKYFNEVSDPVITFNPKAPFTQTWRDFWGPIINTYADFSSFMTGQGVVRAKPMENILQDPEVLRPELMNSAADFHNTYDDYQFPEHIRVVQVAGWGIPTTKTVEYKNNHGIPGYGTTFTVEGDRTVVYPSAVSSVADETYYFNISLFNKDTSQNTQHRNLLSVDPIQDIVRSVVERNSISGINYISATKPPLTEIGTQLIVSTHSPVILGVYDQLGNFTGVDQSQDLSADILSVSENIPGSAFLYTSESQHIFLPKEGTYNFAYKGKGNGPTTVTIEDFTADVATPIASYTDIPTTLNTTATFTLQSTIPENTEIALDVNGDGETEIIRADGRELSLNELITLIKEKIFSLTVTEKLKQNLLKKISSLEKKVENKKQKNIKVLADLEKKISKQKMKGKIDAADADEIIDLLDTLEAQAENIALDPVILTDLKTKIQSLNIKYGLKNDLLKRVEKLENKQRLIRTLSNLTQSIMKKSEKGKIADRDARMLIDLLERIEGVI